MAKLIFFLLLGLLIYQLLKGGRRGPPPKAPRAEGEAMVACARCGLHVPVGESVEEGGRSYCCREHARADGRSQR